MRKGAVGWGFYSEHAFLCVETDDCSYHSGGSSVVLGTVAVIVQILQMKRSVNAGCKYSHGAKEKVIVLTSTGDEKEDMCQTRVKTQVEKQSLDVQ